MTIVHETFALELAKLQRLVPTPTGSLGFGTDLSCTTDLTETMEEVDPNSTRGIGEAALRRLTTPRGELQDDLEYGIDVRSFLNRGTSAGDIQGLQGLVRQELLKDDRVLGAVVLITYASKTLSVDCRLEAADPKLGAFKLTFAIASSGAITVQELG